MRVLASMAVVVLLLAVTSGEARAETGHAELDAAIALYDDLEYEKAAAALEAVLAGPGLTDAQQVEGYRMLALCYLALSREADAISAYERLLRVDPAYALPGTENPRALELFAQAKARLPQPVRLVVSVAPVSPRAGQAVAVSVQVEDPGGRVARVVVHHRKQGGRGWSSVTGQRAGAGWAATISGSFVVGPGLEYFVEALDEAGAVVSGEGDAGAPLLLVVGGDDRVAATPIYGRWWFWAGVGGVVVGGVATFLLLSGDGGGGGDDDATVTITVN